MNIVIKEINEQKIVEIDGRIDTTNAKEFETAITQLLTLDCPDIEINCEKLSYISSSGLRVFLMLQKSVIYKNGKLILKGLNPAILEVFKMTGFDSIFTIE